jgi:hypothetical protein
MPPVDEGRSVTELLSRPRSGATVSDRRRSDKRRSDKRRSDRRSPGPDGQPAWFPLLPSAVVAAAVAVVVGLVLCVGLAVLGWLTAPGADVVAASRIGTWVWLLANGALLHVYAAGPGTVDSPATAAVGFTGPVAIAPLGLSLLLVFVLSRTSAAAIRAAVPVLAERPARRERRPLAVVVGATVLGYVGLTLVVARWLADGAATVRVDLSRTAVGAAVVGALGAGLGMIGAGGGWRRVLRRAPASLAAVVRGAAAGTGALTVASFVLLAVSLGIHLHRVVALSRAVGGGVVGQSLLTLGQLALLPQGIAYALSWITGAGFGVGSGTLVAPSGVVLGPLPAVPALGALPDPGTPGLWATVLVVVPALAGVLAGVLASRGVRLTGQRGLLAAAVAATLAGLGVGVLGTAMIAVSRARLGAGRLAEVGPVLAPAAVLLLASCTIGGLLGVLPAAVRAVLPSRPPVPPARDLQPPQPGWAGPRTPSPSTPDLSTPAPSTPAPSTPATSNQPPAPFTSPAPFISLAPTPPAPVAPAPVAAAPVVAGPSTGSVPVDPVLHRVLELLGADLRLLLRTRGVLGAADCAGDLGPEAQRGQHDREEHDEPGRAEDGAEYRGAGADPRPAGVAEAAHAETERDESGDHGQ